MKKLVSYLFVILLFCGVSSGLFAQTDSQRLVGTWIHIDGNYKEVLVYKADGTFTFTDDDYEDNGIWTVSGNTIIEYVGKEEDIWEFLLSPDGQTLRIKSRGDEWIVYNKQ